MKLNKLALLSFGVLSLAGAGFSVYTVNGSASDSKITTSPSYPSFGLQLPAYETHGIDVSRHQRNIDWEAVSKMRHNEASISFAFIKASEGRTVVDEYFKDNWKDAKQNGLLRGAYHFYRPHLTAEEQIALFIRQVPKLEKGDLPPVLDIEMRGSCPPARLKKNLKRWLVLAENKYGMTPILYTNYGFYKAYLTGKEFKKYPLWIAHYRTADLNNKMEGWDFWQHSDCGRVNGIRGGVDFNVFKGPQEDLMKFCKK